MTHTTTNTRMGLQESSRLAASFILNVPLIELNCMFYGEFKDAHRDDAYVPRLLH